MGDRLATIDIGESGGGAAVPFSVGQLGGSPSKAISPVST